MEHTDSFGYWVRRRRKAHDLTQQQLAARVGCTMAMIRKIEADERRPSHQLADRLATILVVPADQRQLFLQAARALVRVDQLALATQPISLPPSPLGLTDQLRQLPAPPNLLIGRAVEAAAIWALLRHPATRMITLTGPGGTGKTRLALQVASELQAELADEIWFVDLSSVLDPALALPTIALALGIHEQSGQNTHNQLVEYMHGRQTMLLLDNLEQILSVGPQLAALLAALPGLKILATSRFPLHLRVEHEYLVPPLGLPDDYAAESDILVQSYAVQLFLERAQAIQPAFAVDRAGMQAVAAICRRLDGLPLAIELAVARTRLFGPAVLLERLDSGLQLLVGGPHDLPARQQTLRATISWSYQLLTPAEQALFARLGCFSGGWTLAAAEAIADEPQPAIHEALIEKSLIQVRSGPSGDLRFTMLETLREYALEQLVASVEDERVRQRHAAYYLGLAEQAAPELHGWSARLWHDRLNADWDNLRAVLQWSLSAQGEPQLGLRLAGAIWWFWETRGRRREGRAWLATLLAAPGNAAPTAARAYGLLGAAYMADNDRELDLGGALLDEVAQIGADLGDIAIQSRVLWEQGGMARVGSDPLPSLALLEQSLAMFTSLGDQYYIATLLWEIGTIHPDPAKGEQYLRKSLALAQSYGDANTSAMGLHMLGNFAYERGDFVQAERLFTESMAVAQADGDLRSQVHLINSLGWLSLVSGDLARGQAFFHKAREFARRQGETAAFSNALVGLAMVALWQADAAACAAQLHEARTGSYVSREPNYQAWIIQLQGALALQQADLASAETLLSESLERFRKLEDRDGVSVVLCKLGHTSARSGDLPRAERFFHESLRLCGELAKPFGAASCLVGLADLAEVRGQFERATRLWGAAEALEAGTRPDKSGCQPDDEPRVAAARSRLTDAAAVAAWAAGRTLDLNQAIVEALG